MLGAWTFCIVAFWLRERIITALEDEKANGHLVQVCIASLVSVALIISAQIYAQLNGAYELKDQWIENIEKCKNNGEMGTMVEYSIMWNITGFPGGVLPITKVQENE